MSPMPSPLRLKTREDELTWVQRLKKLEKKDLAALAVCLLLLGVLPVIERVLTSSEEGGKLQEGFAVPGGMGDLEAGDVFEPGVGPGAPGGIPGQSGGEVITPLAGRDPSSLVMGLGGPTKQSPAAAAAAEREKGLRDALAESMRRAVPEAGKANPVSTPPARLSTTLANLLGGGGGSGASSAGLRSGADIVAAAKKEPSRSATGPASYAGATPPPGYGGVAQKRPLSSAAGDAEKLKAAADAAAAKMNRTGAVDSLVEAANASKGIGDGGAGGGGVGMKDDESAKKGGPGANTAKGERSFGQSLDQQKDMARWQKELEACYERKKNYAESLSGGMWALFSGNLFADAVDCNEVPEWISGPGGKFLDKYLGGGYFGPIMDGLTEAAADSTKSYLGLQPKSEMCIFYNTADGKLKQEKVQKPKPTKENPNAKEDVRECQNGRAYVKSSLGGAYPIEGSSNCYTNICTPSAIEPKDPPKEEDQTAVTRNVVTSADAAQRNQQARVDGARNPAQNPPQAQDCLKRAADSDAIRQKAVNFNATIEQAINGPGGDVTNNKEAVDRLKRAVIIECHHYHDARAAALAKEDRAKGGRPRKLVPIEGFLTSCQNDLMPAITAGNYNQAFEWAFVEGAPKTKVGIFDVFGTKHWRREHGTDPRRYLEQRQQEIRVTGEKAGMWAGIVGGCKAALVKSEQIAGYDQACLNAVQGRDVLVVKDEILKEIQQACQTPMNRAGS